MNNTHDSHEGGCLCGHVRFRITGPANSTGNCHCHMCQKASGAAFVTMTEFPNAAVTWLGAAPMIRVSSDEAERGFCPKCGGAMTFQIIGAQYIDIATALFDNPQAFLPAYDIFTESAQPWTALDPAIPHFKRGRKDG